MIEESEKGGLKFNSQTTKIMPSGPATSWQIDGETMTDFIFSASKITAEVTAVMKLKDTCSLEGKLRKPRQHIKKQRHHFVDKGPYFQSYGFSS